MTVGDADPIEIPLAPIASMPGPVAGWAAEDGKAFTAQLVAADGTVLATLDDDDMPESANPGSSGMTEPAGP